MFFSMSNQECKVRPQILNVKVDDPIFFLYIVKTRKCSGSCNNINNSLAKLCVPDVKVLNVKVSNLVSGINETRRIEWHETCKCKCRFNSSFCNNKQRCDDDKYRCQCKELIDKCVWDKGFIWNPSNCECKSCDFSEYLDYKNCKWKTRLANKLAEKCTENIYEVKISEVTLTENMRKCISCILYIVFFSIIFTVNIRISTYFVTINTWIVKKENVSRYHYVYQAKNY